MNAPIPMVLHCPNCGMQHVDRPDPSRGWENPPHRSHECQNAKCRTVWRPADVETVGVERIETKGKLDTWPENQEHSFAARMAHACPTLARMAWTHEMLEELKSFVKLEAVRENPLARIRESVTWFAQQMELKLRENDYKGGWSNCTTNYLQIRLREEMSELWNQLVPRIDTRDAESVILEATDVANFAMMIADQHRCFVKD